MHPFRAAAPQRIPCISEKPLDRGGGILHTRRDCHYLLIVPDASSWYKRLIRPRPATNVSRHNSTIGRLYRTPRPIFHLTDPLPQQVRIRPAVLPAPAHSRRRRSISPGSRRAGVVGISVGRLAGDRKSVV